MEIDMKTWGGLKWNDVNFACKYDKSIALNIDIDNFFQKKQFEWGKQDMNKILVGDPKREEELSCKFRTIQSNATLQIAWLMSSIIKKWTFIVLSSNFTRPKLDDLKAK